MHKIILPNTVSFILSVLNQKGYDAYVVGGCVRDSLLGVEPKDWDVCTSATPDNVKDCFKKYRIVDTGIKHGTVTIVIGDEHYEVTTFRTDGEYSDNRRPNTVTFVGNVLEDLARRDFTINAIAYNPTTGIVDPYNGVNDLLIETIACVGDANDRFNEDALRIMRALRFASTYGFQISKQTQIAIHQNKALLHNIAAERINAELCKLLLGKDALKILLDYSDVITTIIPELIPCVGFEQNNKFHKYTVYDHIAHAVSNYSGTDVITKVVLLLHDVGKPACYTEDENGGHFHGHGMVSKDISSTVVNRLRFDSHAQKCITELVLFHDSLIEPTVKTVKRWLNKIGEEQLRRLFDIRMADMLAHSDDTQNERIEKCLLSKSIMEEVLASKECFSLKDLNINGDDIMSLGIPQGRIIGEVLKELLLCVIDGRVPNDRQQLMEYVKINMKRA